MSTPDNDLRCYCCGKPIGSSFALIHMQPEAADRVFVIEPDCVPDVEGNGVTVIPVVIVR